MFNKILKSHFSNDPVEHIYTNNLLDIKEFDRLYENQSRFDSKLWTEFKNKHKLDCTFLNDLNDINMQVDVLCLLFFKERADNKKSPDARARRGPSALARCGSGLAWSFRRAHDWGAPVVSNARTGGTPSARA